MAELNPEQREFVETIDGPVFVVAGPGSGKTKSLVSRVANIINSGVAPEGVLLLTFTNKAADEMKERAEKINEECGKITACTYHSFCAAQLRKYANYIGFTNEYSILTPADVISCIDIIKTQLKLEKVRSFPKSSLISSLISSSINTATPLSLLIVNNSKASRFKNEILKIADEYVTYKKDRNLMDYDDILVMFLKLLKEQLTVREIIEKTYPYIMVDEAQDSNIIQEEIIYLLRQNIKNIAIVGDVNQSLYRFRGADIKTFMRFPEHFSNCKTVTLFRNYRSVQPILDLANDVLDKHATEGIKTVMRSDKPGEFPDIITTSNQQEEAEYILNKIKELHEAGTPYSEISVLCQISAQSFYLETLLTQDKIPYSKRGGLKFLDRVCVVDTLSFLRVITNPTDEIAWFRVLKLFKGVGETYAQRLSDLAVEKKFDLLTDNPFLTYKFADSLAAFKEKLLSWMYMDNLQDLLDDVIYYYAELRKEALDGYELEEKEEMIAVLKEEIESLQALKSYAENFQDISSYIDSFALDAAFEDEPDGVVISTIHSAKGLEWDNVFVMDCVDGICPRTTVDMEGTPEDNESLRCFYVAITRPRKRLFIMQPTSVMVWGKYQLAEPSHFLDRLETVKASA